MSYRKKISTLLLIPSLLLLSPMSQAVTAGGIVGITQAWPANTGYDKFSFFQQIMNDGGPKSHYYWANQFYYGKNEVGYIGLQNRSNNVHAYNYSIWEAKGWKSGNCSYFSHEGKGVQCQLEFPWKVGRQYKLDVIKKGNLVTGIVTDMMDGTSNTIGVIEVEDATGKLNGSIGFVEEYSQGNAQLSSCYVMGTQSSVFLNPKGNDSIEAKQGTYTYGKCNDPYVVQAACNGKACINTVGNLGGVPSPYAPRVPIVNDKDLQAETISSVLDKKQLVVIYTGDYYWTPNIFFPKPDKNKWKSIFVDHRAGYGTSIHINGNVTQINKGQQLMYLSDGTQWNIVQTK